MAPSRWALCALGLLGIVEVIVTVAGPRETTSDALRYASAMATFCPLMAILGAKRPQNRGWQFIVLTLWIVLVLPVGETLLIWRGGTLDPGPIRRWLTVILLFLGLANYLPTRFAIAAIWVTLGQSLLLMTHLPFGRTLPDSHVTAGCAAIAAGMTSAWFVARRGPRCGWDGIWLDFRDAFGLVWSLRVMERLNVTARLSQWNSVLTWSGFRPPIETSRHRTIERALKTVLRRFVSNDWIEQRIDGRSDEPNHLRAQPQNEVRP